ncbi:nuclease-related domain-containing protein [Kitasatospora sp. NPDC093550]|uniref:nuclease-related domain-containing protein n=1 Tax=Kitasatospora sp. NPDC093550 TaxID=3364089 RepID=UPI0038228B4C
MGELTVKPWRRPGQDRVYVNVVGVRGEAAAWLDCQTGVVTINDESYRDASVQKLTAWCQSCGRTIPPLTVVSKNPDVPAARPTTPRRVSAPAAPLATPLTPPPATIPALPTQLSEEDDLARNRPGTGVRGMIQADQSRRKWLVRVVARIVGDDLASAELTKGLGGEERVGGILDGLCGSGWYVLHGIPLPSGADIDHVVIGPPGVFTVNTKHHPDAHVWVGDKYLTVNRNSFPYLQKSAAEAAKTAALLRHWSGVEVPVQPVIAVVGARQLTHKGKPDVMVLDGERIADALTARPAVLPPHRVASLFDIARRRPVWSRFGKQ